ncbi:MAG: DUF2723 domain-containing protein [Elusimicrobia bacterium]|nr:DUF2723 domain-containing protein [Elusimicrobiota bacterium]
MRAAEPWLVFLAFLVLDVVGMAPSVTFGDSGELAAAAATLSVAHAPGYPLQALLGKAFGTVFALGNWAYRTNLLTAVLAAAALAVLSSGLGRAGFSGLARLGAVAFVGCSGLWRHESAVTEVFGLHLLSLACVVWTVASFAGALWRPRPMAALGLGMGLGLANHHTLVLAAPAVLWQALAERVTARKAWLGVGVAAAFVGLGLACYAYLPVRSTAGPPLDWGHPTNLGRFMRVLLRKDYGSFSLTVEGQGEVARWSQAWRYLKFTFTGFGPAASALAVLGFAAWSRLQLRLHWGFAALLALTTGPFFLALGNPPFDPQTDYALERFYLASWMGLALPVAAGLEYLRSSWAWAGRALVLVPLISAACCWSEWFVRWDLASYDYGRNMLRTLPRGASLFMDGGDDTFYSLAFLTYGQGLRPDLDLHDRGGVVFKSAYGPDFRGLPRELKEQRRLQAESALASAGALFYSTVNDWLLPGFSLAPVGVLRRPVREGSSEQMGTDAWEFYCVRYAAPLLARHYRHRALVAFYPVMRAAFLGKAGRTREALLELRRALDLGPDVLWLKPAVTRALEWQGFSAFGSRDWDLAEEVYALAARLDPGQPDLLLNLGAVYEKQGKSREAEDALLRCVDKAPRSVQAWRNLGTVYWTASRWKESAEAFGKALELKPGDPELMGFEARSRARASSSRPAPQGARVARRRPGRADL